MFALLRNYVVAILELRMLLLFYCSSITTHREKLQMPFHCQLLSASTVVSQNNTIIDKREHCLEQDYRQVLRGLAAFFRLRTYLRFPYATKCVLCFILLLSMLFYIVERQGNSGASGSEIYVIGNCSPT